MLVSTTEDEERVKDHLEPQPYLSSSHQAEEEATMAALIQDLITSKARMEADRLLALRLQEEERERAEIERRRLRNEMKSCDPDKKEEDSAYTISIHSHCFSIVNLYLYKLAITLSRLQRSVQFGTYRITSNRHVLQCVHTIRSRLLNAATGGNLLNRTPRDALTIIENNSKVRTSRNNPVVSKASATSSSTTAYLPEITALTDAVKAMLLQNKTPSPAPGNTFNASAATGTYNQGGPGYPPQGETNYRDSNQSRPPSFPQPNAQNNQNHFNQRNQNSQAPLNQTQVGPLNDFSNYMKTNDANIRAMQNQITNMKAEFKNEV
ncbi:hypothetical protein Tco_1406196 [Tanacetum coccineum]